MTQIILYHHLAILLEILAIFNRNEFPIRSEIGIPRRNFISYKNSYKDRIANLGQYLIGILIKF